MLKIRNFDINFGFCIMLNMLLTSSSLYVRKVPVFPFDMFNEGNWIMKTFSASWADVNCQICDILPFMDILHMIHEVHNWGESHIALWALFYFSTCTPTRIPSLFRGSAVKAAPVFSFLKCLIEFTAQFCHSSSSSCSNRRCCIKEGCGPSWGRSGRGMICLVLFILTQITHEWERCFRFPRSRTFVIRSKPVLQTVICITFSTLNCVWECQEFSATRHRTLPLLRGFFIVWRITVSVYMRLPGHIWVFIRN